MTPEERTQKLETALGLFNQAKFSESGAVLKEILDYEIRDAPALFLLGQISQQQNNFDLARDLYKQSIKLDPEQADVWAQLGSVLNDLRDEEGAKEAIKKAIEINPNQMKALKFLADIYLNRGEKEKGIECLEKAIEANPGFVGGYLNYVMAADIFPDHPIVERIKQLLDVQKDNKAASSVLNYSLSYIFERAGDTKKFFKYLHLANEQVRDPESKWRNNLENHLENTKTIMTAEFLTEKVDVKNKIFTPIFIVGMPRSGTSLTDQIFATHSLCFGGDELQYFGKYLARVSEAKTGHEGFKGWKELAVSDLEVVANLYQQRVQQLAPEFQFISDKMPWNFRNIGMITKILPWAKIIHIYRDPLDCGFSCYRNPLSKNIEFTCGMEDYAYYRKYYQDTMNFWKERLPDSYIDVSYEQLVSDPENEIRRVLDYCGLPWEENLLNFHKTKRQVRTMSKDQVNQPLYKGSIGKAYKYKKHLAPMIKALEGYGLLGK